MPARFSFWEVHSAQEIGRRPDQQDRGGAWLSPDGERVFAVLADGAGGHRQGARAAELAVATAEKLWKDQAPPTASFAFLEEASRAAHEAIDRPDSGASAARTTWVALMADARECAWVHSGDSRLYHFAAGQLVARTRDHSVAQILVDQGKIRPEVVSSHPDRSTLLESLGGGEYQPVEGGSGVLRGDDVFVLCTDGLWNHVSDGEILAATATPASHRQKAISDLAVESVRRAADDADNASIWCIARA